MSPPGVYESRSCGTEPSTPRSSSERSASPGAGVIRNDVIGIYRTAVEMAYGEAVGAFS